MEHSLNSYKQNRPAIREPEEEEESGWTAYFEDFSNQQHQEHSSCSSLGTSMVSDAASCAAWRLSDQKFPGKLRFKKPRTKEISQDDSLEDTASSPVNSPKVSDLKPMDMSLRTAEDHHMSSSLRKGYMSEGYARADPADVLTRLQQQQQQQQMNFSMKNDCTDEEHLKKRGLCLVPMSMLVNYFG